MQAREKTAALLTFHPLQTLSGPILFRDQPIPFLSSPVLPLREHTFPSPNKTQYKLLTSKLNWRQFCGPKGRKFWKKRHSRQLPAPIDAALFPLPTAGSHDSGRRRLPRRHFVHTRAVTALGAVHPLFGE